MILAWSITEIVRYGFYECALLGVDIPILTWARYVPSHLALLFLLEPETVRAAEPQLT